MRQPLQLFYKSAHSNDAVIHEDFIDVLGLVR